MTVEERVRRVEQWIASKDTAEMMRLQAVIRASLDAPRDEPAGTGRYCARHAVGSAYGCGVCKDERIAALEAERDEARGEAARARANEIQMRTERDAARRERYETWENAARIVEAHIITGRAWTQEQEQAAKMLMDVAAAIRARAVVVGKAGGEPSEAAHPGAVRLICDVMPDGRFYALGGDRAPGDPMADRPYLGADRIEARIRRGDGKVGGGDYLEALCDTKDREIASLRDERDAEQRRAMAAESERDVLREERDSLRAQLADAHRVLAQGETIDAATERDTAEKMERLERGVREAENAIRGVASFYSPTHKCWCLDNPRNDCHLEYCLAARAWLQEFGS